MPPDVGDKSRQRVADKPLGIERGLHAEAGAREQACGIAAIVREREHRPSRAKVLVRLGGNLAVAVGRLKEQERIGGHHLAERRAIGNGGLQRDDVADVRGQRGSVADPAFVRSCSRFERSHQLASVLDDAVAS